MTRQRALLAVILLGGAALRFWAIGFGLPYPEARPDETTIVITSTGLLYGGMNPHFFHWPSLMFYIVAAVYRIGWEIGHLQGHFVLKFDMFKDAAVHAGPYIMVARVIAAASGTLTIWLVYKLALRLFDRLTAITAAFFVAAAFLHVRDSHFGVTDVPMTALVVAAMLPLATLLGDPSRVKTWVFAGALAGLAASTKYNGGVVAASGVAVAMVHLAGGDATARRDAVRGLAAYAGAALIAFLAGTPYALLDWPHFIEGLRFDASHLMEGHGVVLGRGWRYHLTFSLWYGMGAPLLFAALAGLAVVWRSWRKAILLCSFPLLYFFVVGRGYTVFVRYITPVVPFLCLAAAIFVVELTRRIVAPARLPGAVAAIAVLIVWPSLVRDWRFDRLMGQTDTRVLATDWVNARRETRRVAVSGAGCVPLSGFWRAEAGESRRVRFRSRRVRRSGRGGGSTGVDRHRRITADVVYGAARWTAGRPSPATTCRRKPLHRLATSNRDRGSTSRICSSRRTSISVCASVRDRRSEFCNGSSVGRSSSATAIL